MGSVTLVVAIAINLLLRIRVPPRRSGPLADWRAFTEMPYVFFVVGFFLIYWAVYFAFYYVSTFPDSILEQIEPLTQVQRLTSTVILSPVSLRPIQSAYCSPPTVSG